MHHPVCGKENSLHQKEGAQLRVHLTVKYLGHSPGGNKVPVLIVLLLFKEMEGSGRGKAKCCVIIALVCKTVMRYTIP